MTGAPDLDEGRRIAEKVETFVRMQVFPFEKDRRWLPHGPTEELVTELRAMALRSRVLTPHIVGDSRHLSFQATALVFQAAGLSPLGPVALNVAAPDEANMYLLDKIGTASQKQNYLEPLLSGTVRSAFFMTEPAGGGGAGSDPSMMQTTATRKDDHWLIQGRKAFITGAQGASVGIIMAKTDASATMFVVPLPDPAIHIERVYDTLDGSMPGGHALVAIEGLHVSSAQILGELNEGFRYAQIRLAPARLTHCMRWLGAARRCQEIATNYATRRHAFNKLLIDHEGVGFMLADNLIDLKQCELLISWCAGVLDDGGKGTLESSMTKVAVSEGLYRTVDRCVQIMGATGVSGETVVAQVFRELRAFRIYDGPTEVHKWSIAKAIKKQAQTIDASMTGDTHDL